ncbi:MAG: hypothetical protein RLY60_2051 [Pseudomonadota bacterium]
MMTTSIFDMYGVSSLTKIINQHLASLWRVVKSVFLGSLLVLSGCSLVVPGYNNAPNLLMFLWINPHVDLNADQEKQTLADLKTVLEWHRQQQLPLYADWLKSMQKLAAEDVTADQVCHLAQSITDSLDPLIDQFEEPLTRLSLTLTTAQLQTLKKKYQQDLKDYRKEWKLDASAEDQLDVQVDKGQANAERFYGRLSPSQKKLLRQLAQNSGYEAERTFAERERQQRESLAMHTRIVQSRPTPEEARIWVRQWLQSSLHSADPEYAAYLKKRKRLNCEASAQLHNITTTEQRTRAVKVLKGYEEDVRALMRSKP